MEERIIKDINNLLTQLFQKMKEAGYEWDAEKKELKKIEQKPAENSCKNSNDITTKEIDMTEYKKGFECGKQRVLKYPEDFGLCNKPADTFDFEKKALKKIEQKPLQWNISDYKTWQYIVSDVLTKHDGIGQYLDDGFCKKIAKYMQEEWSKKLCSVQHPTMWSEEDEKMIENIIDTINMSIEDCDVDDISTKARFSLEKERNWLKNKLKYLRPQNTWKPSDEQITWLYRAADDASKDSRMKQVLNNLLLDLKKLIGE